VAKVAENDRYVLALFIKCNKRKVSKYLRICLGLSERDKQQRFLDYFNASFRQRGLPLNGTGSYSEDGTYTAVLTGDFPVGDGSICITWKIVHHPDGTIPFIEVLPANLEEADLNWETAVQTFVMEILVSVIDKKIGKFFRRTALHYVGPNLEGEYWLPGFRLAPAIPNDENPQMVNAERILYIDHNVEAIDDVHATTIAEGNAKCYAARLSLILAIGLYRPPPEHKWFLRIPPDSPSIYSERFQLGFVDSSPSKNVMPKKGAECRLGSYRGSVLQPWGASGVLACPTQIRQILRGVDNGEPRLKEAFDSCARLYQVAHVVGRMFPSVGMAYEIAAVEAITQAYPKKYKGFSDFMRQNAPPMEGLEKEGFEKFLDFLYGSVRSAHFHSGEFPFGEFLPVGIGVPDRESLERSDRRVSGYKIIRKSIMGWVLQMVDSKD
jgi:hypothetical protein